MRTTRHLRVTLLRYESRRGNIEKRGARRAARSCSKNSAPAPGSRAVWRRSPCPGWAGQAGTGGVGLVRAWDLLSAPARADRRRAAEQESCSPGWDVPAASPAHPRLVETLLLPRLSRSGPTPAPQCGRETNSWPVGAWLAQGCLGWPLMALGQWDLGEIVGLTPLGSQGQPPHHSGMRMIPWTVEAAPPEQWLLLAFYQT